MKMKKRPNLSLNSGVVEEFKQDSQSYQINSNKSLQFRAFLFNEAGMYTKDGRELPTTVKKENIDYSTKRNVGAGASGDVYFARLKGGTPIAMKRIPISSKSHRDEVDRELQFFSARCDSPYVMNNYGAFWDAEDDAIVIPMEWMPYTVKDLDQFWGGLNETLLKAVFFQVISGLVYLHDVKRVLHRDLKPSNLLISEDGHVKIADFGVSKLIQTLAVSSTYVGTMCYMAPERLEQGIYGLSSDVWSVGLTMISAVTGKNPWAPPEEMNLFQLLAKMKQGSTPTLPESGNFSDSAKDFVKQCLKRDPDARPTCAELLKHPFFAGMTESTSQAMVRMAVEQMTRLINNNAQKQEELARSQESMEKDVNAQLDKLIS
ncbi:mitogen-activated protein kinase kinase putative (MKK) [Leptomonas seymouri]|uniref:mitogen-activated protein kinase kinase n=1 Tax=Leptomonas seymouri TaxID=5684 RepID=A0A0N1HVN6_LEPSE|nr:mitogen-activated protein kinase kinase putative (MKK) [Leptomonas seymouri]|eukprot:KPI84690.1 mitogen-activated protein kinase kinase putative (MKK) [Leptomonas seymouri]